MNAKVDSLRKISSRDYPKKILLREDGPREGFQMLPSFVPTDKKLELITALAKTGVKYIEVTSFVRKDLVPQMADAEDLVSRLLPIKDVHYTALYLNEKGFERASAYSQLQLEGVIHLAASEEFLRRNNNTTVEKVLSKIPAWLALWKSSNVALARIMVSAAFGDTHIGKVESETTLAVCEKAVAAFRAHGQEVPEVTFADTTGWANPESILRTISEFRSRYPSTAVALHLHDTRGTGMANVYAGLAAGVDRFDCSVGGLGGCPFATGAQGNVPTEDVAFLAEELGIETGVNLEAYIECAKLAESLAGKSLPGKLKLGGLLTVVQTGK